MEGWGRSHVLSGEDEKLENDCGGKRMSGTEGIPLWDSVTHPLAIALEFAFGCHHTKLSRVFTIDGHRYKVCCDCGATFDYSLRTMSITHHRRLLAALKRLRAQRRWRKLLRRTPGA